MKSYISKNGITIYQGCALEVLKEMEDKQVDMVMTSPPYWNLRDYGHNGQLGLEPTYQEYINKLVSIFDEVKRVLKDMGTCWVNLGDTYSTISGSMGDERFKQPKYEVAEDSMNFKQPKTNLQSKSLIGIPERFVIAMQDSGWIRRNTIIWYKSNCMPSSANDRFTVDFEYLYFFTKKPQYYFEQQFEEASRDWNNCGGSLLGKTGWATDAGRNDDTRKDGTNADTTKRNKRCVWQLSTEPYPDAHFATYPEKLCETPIKAGCPSHICKKCGKAREKIYTSDFKGDSNKRGTRVLGRHQGQSGLPPDAGESNRQFKGYTDCGCNAGFEGGVVMDPFMGSGTTLKVVRELGRKGIGIELNQEYIDMAIKRINLKQVLFEFK